MRYLSWWLLALWLCGCASRPVEYVASQKSQVFHRSGCSEASHIKAENLVRFGDRRQAAAGHRPCEVCKP